MGNTSKRVPLFCAASLACSLAFAGAGCAEGGAVSADSPVVADGVTTSEPFLSPMSSREVLLDEVTKPTLVSLVFYQAGTAEGVVRDMEGQPDREYYDEDVLRKYQEREERVTDLLARVVSMEASDTEALEAAYGELLDILEVDESPGMWERLDAEEGGGRA